jgi:DNA-binding transcriptional LysR family regulator
LIGCWRRVDAGFLLGPIANAELSGFEIGGEPLVVVLPAGHPLARQDVVSLASLAKEPFVFGESQSWSGFRRLIHRTSAQYGFSPTVVQEATSPRLE